MAATVTLNGASLTLDPSGAVWWPAQSTLALADLHLEEAAAPGKLRRLLPPFDRRATLARLALVLRRYRPQRVVAMGGTSASGAGLAPADAARLARLVAAHDWIWVTGGAPPPGGRTLAELALPPLVFRPAPAAGAAPGEICGHLAPKAAVRARGRRIAGRSFVTDGSRLLLPAFGAASGGHHALDPAISRLFAGQVRVYLIGRETIYLYAAERLERLRRPEPAFSAR